MNKRKFVPVAIALVAVIAVSGVAYAYWSAGGSGSGSGNTAAGATVTVNQVAPALNPMYPGDAVQTTHVTITNNSATQSVHVTTVSITAITSNPAGCTLTDFTVASAAVPAGSQDIAGGATTASFNGPTIHFYNDPGKNQDYCKNVPLTLTFSAS